MDVCLQKGGESNKKDSRIIILLTIVRERNVGQNIVHGCSGGRIEVVDASVDFVKLFC